MASTVVQSSKEGEHQHDQRVSSISFKFDGELNVKKLQRWLGIMLKKAGQDMFRYKGLLAVKGMDSKFVFQGVHMLFSGGFQKEFQWKDGETRSCRFVSWWRCCLHLDFVCSHPLNMIWIHPSPCSSGKWKWIGISYLTEDLPGHHSWKLTDLYLLVGTFWGYVYKSF